MKLYILQVKFDLKDIITFIIFNLLSKRVNKLKSF